MLRAQHSLARGVSAAAAGRLGQTVPCVLIVHERLSGLHEPVPCATLTLIIACDGLLHAWCGG